MISFYINIMIYTYLSHFIRNKIVCKKYKRNVQAQLNVYKISISIQQSFATTTICLHF